MVRILTIAAAVAMLVLPPALPAPATGPGTIPHTTAALAAPVPPPAPAATSLNIPRTVDGHRTNVALVIFGHSTSDQGDYPQKLALALNSNPADGRNYQVFELITGGDGGFLWSQARFAPGDLQYHRVAASNPLQWCTDAAGNRWSLRRVRVDRALNGSGDPTGGACPNTAPPNMTCTYYDAAGAHTATGFGNCLARMDFKLALIQDTTNRSWPIDDWNLDGAVTTGDTWPASRIPDAAEPCGNGRNGVINGRIDWNCDGTLNGLDASHAVYAGWLERFSLALLSHVDHVFVAQKPLEFGATCPNYPVSEQANCRPHNTRTPTASRPFDHFYNPLVYWEWRAVQATLNTDPRIHPGESSPRRMHIRSDDCYDVGITTWAIPATVPGRPTSITADDAEWQGGQEVDAENTGCMRADHIHHNAAGGWLMADVWYEGLTPYLN
ncbi:hypothetical protein [Allorhizocola rhizosphaerae]|uniref:hypothetical protein n=1 Tax=Allorhizocola rhizosphaerae TaxID=1872709 RepID=UPI000E3BC5B6|nr:hypothetical protein [Allorhizocola rhizosphaerae]